MDHLSQLSLPEIIAGIVAVLGSAYGITWLLRRRPRRNVLRHPVTFTFVGLLSVISAASLALVEMVPVDLTAGWRNVYWTPLVFGLAGVILTWEALRTRVLLLEDGIRFIYAYRSGSYWPWTEVASVVIADTHTDIYPSIAGRRPIRLGPNVENLVDLIRAVKQRDIPIQVVRN